MKLNTEKAIRAKRIAEQRMETGDYAGALKAVLKAQRLSPELENISQMLTVCHVNCSAQNKSGIDWYGILQIDRFSDVNTVKKQYRRLALLLHPDKNKFTGAEAAFKLIGEANCVLTDPKRRHQYDIDMAKKKAPPETPNSEKSYKKSDGNKQNEYGSTSSFRKAAPDYGKSYEKSDGNKQNEYGSASSFRKAAPNYEQSYKKSDGNKQEEYESESSFQKAYSSMPYFWTCCTGCGVRFQYKRCHEGKGVNCSYCKTSFVACDLGFQATSPRFCCRHLSNHGVPCQGN